MHWASFNEPPKSTISKRAVINDFQGEFTFFREPLPEVLSIARRWNEKSALWWTLRNRDLLERVSTPLTASRDEWSEAFMDLSKLIVEGFETKIIRAKLDNLGVTYDTKEQSVALLERLIGHGRDLSEPARLAGLRTVQLIRSKVKGHAGSSEAEQIAHDALMEHETYTRPSARRWGDRRHVEDFGSRAAIRLSSGPTDPATLL